MLIFMMLSHVYLRVKLGGNIGLHSTYKEFYNSIGKGSSCTGFKE